ncbi:MSMEG_1061 family FMN-dependent PPOX-type flavoprotein [Bradyrhizobium sp. LHD-71]|uniref:MSMEG_1061 family FMN-dependent PPOX-type flavoprotein n=1 Tax=Bradyrhizobium sp. LHD-71 TaxID=3072141 RepID=UPI00280FF60F|nr:MSMEG_1061 family FMN-dependent PPOX-type flavoprotein [Bradyrhizobium sp. LHD-71]MDQ8726274.1 pyridoxamine 5'-phosphate oxidase family protein [Bradyrhizobium sp. LHD-71]
MARITTVEQLRQVLPEPRATTRLKILPELDEQAREFVETSPFVFLATADKAGAVEVSPKGDEPGFVKIENAKTLLMPERAGNNLAFGLQNILAMGSVGLIFVRPRTGETLRVSGRAEVFDDTELLQRLGSEKRPALLAIRIHIERCFFHCARAFLRARLWEPDSWGEARRISFGKVIAPRMDGDQTAEKQIDDRVAASYTTRLWSNT